MAKNLFSGSNMIEVTTEKALAAAANYADEDVLSESATTGTAWTFSNVGSENGRVVFLHKSIISIETTDLTPVLNLFLFNITPTGTTNDNVPNNNPILGDKEELQCQIAFPAMTNEGGISYAQVIHNPPIPIGLATGDKDLYGILTTGSAITNEAAGMPCLIKLMFRESIDN